VRGALPAHADPLLAGAAAATDRFVGHARFASNRSTVSAENAHPFLHGGVALAHNGTFFGRIGAEAGGRGVSDSLVFLERLAGAWRGGGLDALAAALASLLSDRELVGEYTAANLLLLRGADLFAFRRSRKDHDYYALFRREGGGVAEAASEPLGGDGWTPFGEGELVELSREGLPGTVLDLP
jgi:predicted glutamine amidotransferase